MYLLNRRRLTSGNEGKARVKEDSKRLRKGGRTVEWNSALYGKGEVVSVKRWGLSCPLLLL